MSGVSNSPLSLTFSYTDDSSHSQSGSFSINYHVQGFSIFTYAPANGAGIKDLFIKCELTGANCVGLSGFTNVQTITTNVLAVNDTNIFTYAPPNGAGIKDSFIKCDLPNGDNCKPIVGFTNVQTITPNVLAVNNLR